jgi:hypothetical protein
MSWDKNVIVTIQNAAQAVARAVLNIPLFYTQQPTFPDRVRTYTSAAAAAADPLLGTEGTAAVDAHFEQTLHAPSIKIGRGGDAAVAQVITWTLSGTPVEGDAVYITINGIKTEYVAGATPTLSSIHAALSAAVTSAVAAEDVTISGVDPDIVSTADIAGEGFTYASGVTQQSGSSLVITPVVTAANAGVGSDLDAIKLADNGWFGLTSQIHPTPATNLEVMKACGAWVQANGKLYIGQSSDAGVLTKGAGNDLAELAKSNRPRVAYIWHHDDTELLAVAWMSYSFQADPDQQSTIWAYKPLVGISQKSPVLTDTELQNIQDQNGNAYDDFGGNDVTGMGITTTGKKIDIVITESWLEARLQERYIQTLSDVSARNEKIAYNDKALQIFPNDGREILRQGVRAEHLNPGTTFISVPLRADTPSADITNRLVRVTAGGEQAGAAELVVVTMTLSI